MFSMAETNGLRMFGTHKASREGYQEKNDSAVGTNSPTCVTHTGFIKTSAFVNLRFGENLP